MSDRFVSWEEAVAWLIGQPDKQELVRDCYFDASPEIAANRYWQSEEWRAIRSLLPQQPGQALDVGAGRGIASYALAREGWKVLALEPDPSQLVGGGAIREITLHNQLPIEVLHGFGEQIPCPSETFELIFARQVLHHAHDLPALCRELFRVLKPGGRLVAVRDHVISSPCDMEAFWRIHPLHALYGGENAYTEKQYLHALRGAGFCVKQMFRPFDSVINFAPYTRDTLRSELQTRLSRFPLGRVCGRLLNAGWGMTLVLNLLSRIDRRPGRLYSFVCTKPEVVKN